jgi:hypothetical protein
VSVAKNRSRDRELSSRTIDLIAIATGSISMGLGGSLAGKTDIEHHDAEQRREIEETEDVPEQEAAEVAAILREFGLDELCSCSATSKGVSLDTMPGDPASKRRPSAGWRQARLLGLPG